MDGFQATQSPSLLAPSQTFLPAQDAHLALDSESTPDTAYEFGDLASTLASSSSDDDQPSSSYAPTPSGWFNTEESQFFLTTTAQPYSDRGFVDYPSYSQHKQSMSPTFQCVSMDMLYNPGNGPGVSSPPSGAEGEQNNSEMTTRQSYVCQWSQCGRVFSDPECLQ